MAQEASARPLIIGANCANEKRIYQRITEQRSGQYDVTVACTPEQVEQALERLPEERRKDAIIVTSDNLGVPNDGIKLVERLRGGAVKGAEDAHIALVTDDPLVWDGRTQEALNVSIVDSAHHVGSHLDELTGREPPASHARPRNMAGMSR